MLDVQIDKIIPVTEARDNFNKLIDDVEGSDELYVLTKNGKPSAVIVGVHHLEKLTGTSHEELMGASAGSVDLSEDTATPETTTTEQTTSATAPLVTAETTEAVPPAIDLTNFPADDAGSDPAPIINEELPKDEVAPGITNVTSDPTLSDSPFDTSKTEQTIGVTTNSTTPIQSSNQSTIGQRGFQNTNPAPAPETAAAPSVADDAPLEDPLDFLSNIEANNQSTAPATNAANVATTPVVNPVAEATAPATATFSDISTGPNGSTTPDEIVAPTEGIFAEPEEESSATPPQSQPPIQGQTNPQQIQQ